MKKVSVTTMVRNSEKYFCVCMFKSLLLFMTKLKQKMLENILTT